MAGVPIDNNTDNIRNKQMMDSPSVNKWPIIDLIQDRELVSRIRLAVVYHHVYLVFITEEDEAYGLNINIESYFNNHSCDYMKPRKIDCLSGVGVWTIVCKGGEFVGLTAENQLIRVKQIDFQLEDKRLDYKFECQQDDGLAAYRFVQVAAGIVHFLALTEDGRVFSWGNNECGQLGLETDVEEEQNPKIIDDLEGQRITKIACGALFSIALTETGQLYCWGRNENGELGLGNDCELELVKSPVLIKNLEGVVIRQIACAALHAFALADDGTIFAWGNNNVGQLGIGFPSEVQKEPTRINMPNGIKFADVICNANDGLSIALTTDGRYMAWGRFYANKPIATASKSINDIEARYSYCEMTFKPMSFEKQLNVNSQADFTVDLASWPLFDLLYEYNPNLKGQIKIINSNEFEDLEISLITKTDEAYHYVIDKSKIITRRKIEALSGIEIKSLCNRPQSRLKFFALIAKSGQIVGVEKNASHDYVEFPQLEFYRFIQLIHDYQNVMALSHNGYVFFWKWGQDIPRRVNDQIGDKCIVAISCGSHFSLVLTDKGEVYAWGENELGQLGLGKEVVNSDVPTRIEALKEFKVQKIACGFNHALAVTKDGLIYGWGTSYEGQLGIGFDEFRQDVFTKTDRYGTTRSMACKYLPVKVQTPAGVKFVDVFARPYDFLSAGLTDDGRFFVWGKCQSGMGVSGFIVLKPTETSVKSVTELYSTYFYSKRIWKTVRMRMTQDSNRIQEFY